MTIIARLPRRYAPRNDKLLFVDGNAKITYNIIMKEITPTKNNLVFVKDENTQAFREHILQRAEEAKKSENRLPLSALKKRLAKYNQKIHA
jgi:hypothetical protein